MRKRPEKRGHSGHHPAFVRAQTEGNLPKLVMYRITHIYY